MKLIFNETSIFYTRKGSGPALVLLHGFLESATMWERLSMTLAQKNTVLTIDLPGHGQSECLDETHTMEIMAETVNALLQKEKIGTAGFIGHSMGGYVALAFAELFPEKTDSLILLNSSPAEDSPERKQNRDRAIELMLVNPKGFIQMAISNLFAETSRKQFASEIAALKKEALSFPVHGIIAGIRGMRDRKDRTSVLKHFKKRKYMICGTKDPIIPLEVSEILSKHCETPLIKVESGHMTLTENYEEVVKIMLFID
ncbi:alpha/beta fold hydrolase [Constantimarinum furrinae]|uniref:Alpha/beta fold hydrolase n=1 Tax=Constantimarinum furrinae TaxID=2562285 RepID=A0A7G8PSL1_9FLAO|nr:alpha/beta hydrolase [Constantimarinum furrinae]QNJ97327.1 Alpha/beta fold hydrolase [Constantimarinum furrinae]